MGQAVVQDTKPDAVLPPAPRPEGMKALDKTILEGLPIQGAGVLRTQADVEREELHSSIDAARTSMRGPDDADANERYADALRHLGQRFRALAQGPRAETYLHLADELDTVRTAHFRFLLPEITELDRDQSEFRQALQQASQQGLSDRNSMIRHLAEKHWLLVDPDFANPQAHGASSPVTPVEGILEFKAEGQTFQICLYRDENRSTFGHVTPGGMIAVNLAACKLDEAGGPARVRKVIANELAHAYLQRVKEFPAFGEMPAAFALGNAPPGLDKRAGEALARLQVIMRSHIHETISDYWSTTVDAGLASEAQRLVQVTLSSVLRGDNSLAAQERPQDITLTGQTHAYALSSAIVLRTLESIERAGKNPTGFAAELKQLQELQKEINALQGQRKIIDTKREKIEELGSQIAEYLESTAVENAFETLGAPDRDKLIAALGVDLGKKVREVETEMLKLTGGKPEELLTFRNTVGEQLEKFDAQIQDKNSILSDKMEQAAIRIAGKLTPADRELIRGTIAHYGRFLLTKVESAAPLKLPPRP